MLWYHQVPLWNPWTCGGEVLSRQSAVARRLADVPAGAAVRHRARRQADAASPTTSAPSTACIAWRAASSSSLPSSILAADPVRHRRLAGAALRRGPLQLLRRRAVSLRRCTSIGARATQIEWAIPLGCIAAWIVGDGGTSTPPMCMVHPGDAGDHRRRASAARCVRSCRSPPPAWSRSPSVRVRVLPALEFALDHPRHLFETDANYPWRWCATPIGGRASSRSRASATGSTSTAGACRTDASRLWLVGAARAQGAHAVLDLRRRRRRHRRRQRLALRSVVAPAPPADLPRPARAVALPDHARLGVPLLCAWRSTICARGKFWRRRWLHRRCHRRLPASTGWPSTGCATKRRSTCLERSPPRARLLQVVGEWRSMMSNVIENHGAIGCDEEAPLQRALELDEGPVPQARVADPATGTHRRDRAGPPTASSSTSTLTRAGDGERQRELERALARDDVERRRRRGGARRAQARARQGRRPARRARAGGPLHAGARTIARARSSSASS